MFAIDAQVIASCGYGAVAIGVALESIGVPFPGETTLIAAALYAGASHRLISLPSFWRRQSAQRAAEALAFGSGRQFGPHLLLKFGSRLGITPRRIKLSQYLFLLHGGKFVLIGRFLPYARAIVSFAAGTSRMTWSRFLVFNSIGATVWSIVVGGGAYHLGKHVDSHFRASHHRRFAYGRGSHRGGADRLTATGDPIDGESRNRARQRR